MNDANSGVSAGQTQYSVCQHGLLRGEKVTNEEREAACKEFQQITGINISPPDSSPDIALISGITFASLIIGITLGYLLCAYTLGQKKNTRKSTRRSK